jgi:hypothetical protein
MRDGPSGRCGVRGFDAWGVEISRRKMVLEGRVFLDDHGRHMQDISLQIAKKFFAAIWMSLTQRARRTQR